MKNDYPIKSGVSGDKAQTILKSVVRQMSDGIFKDTPSIEKYRSKVHISDKCEIVITTDNSDDGTTNGFYNMEDLQIIKFFARKIKKICDIERDRNPDSDCSFSAWNSTRSSYLSDEHNDVSFADALFVYRQMLNFAKDDGITVKEVPQEVVIHKHKVEKVKTTTLDSFGF